MAVGMDLRGDPIALTAALVDIPSESRHEQRIADEIEAALRDQTTGFEVVPRLSGDRVFLDIAAQRESFRDSGAVQGQRASSAVSARLGEWFELGGIASGGVRDERGILSASSARSADSRRVWVKVEELRN